MLRLWPAHKIENDVSDYFMQPCPADCFLLPELLRSKKKQKQNSSSVNAAELFREVLSQNK